MNLAFAVRAIGVGAVAASTLTGCDSTDTIKLSEAAAGDRCLNLARAKLGLPVTNRTEVMTDEEQVGSGSFRFVSTGQFVTDLRAVRLPGYTKSFDVTCTGDFNRRTISSLQIDGTISRPAKPEDWVFQ